MAKKHNSSMGLIVIVLVIVGFVTSKCDKSNNSVSGISKSNTVYESVLPPYSYNVQKEATNDIYNFYGMQPPLDIEKKSISVECANRILASIGLQPVESKGLNVEHYKFQNAKIGAGRLYRTDYRWDDYAGGPLTFVRESYGCEFGNSSKQYDCLKKIIIGPTNFDEYE